MALQALTARAVWLYFVKEGGTIDHINPISASRMRLVPTPKRNNPTSARMSHQSA
jgi:hypothetical protein